MADFYEIDFLAVETKKSGDAISIRYEVDGQTYIHVVDGGFQSTGDAMVAHLKAHYGNPARIDHVVVTHPDGDHTVGLRTVLESFEIGALWMLRPWTYAEELIDQFETYNSIDRLQAKLKSSYPNISALEDIALEKKIIIMEPIQGAKIGHFTVLAPSPARYRQLILDSDKTPELTEEAGTLNEIEGAASKFFEKVINFVKSLWGAETFSPEPTSRENEMSVVQFANLKGRDILLTGDAGREALTEAIEYAPSAGLTLPGLKLVQIPHHGSRRNVSTEILDALLGARLSEMPEAGTETFTAIVSSAKADEHHPRKAVVRAFMHRGAKVLQTEGKSICHYSGALDRAGWVKAQPVPYPNEQEEA